MHLYVATSNSGKLRDFAAVASVDVVLEPLPGLGEIPTPAEDESTFEGNARLKAIFYSRYAPGQVVLADDSGLEVDALGGAPGVRSARYAEDFRFVGPEGASLDERNNLYLVQLLGGVSEPRRARYCCVLAAARDGEILATAEGSVEGEIVLTPRGEEGFGYDPLFYLPEQKKTMAELEIRSKLGFSHRGRAFAVLLASLLEQQVGLF